VKILSNFVSIIAMVVLYFGTLRIDTSKMASADYLLLFTTLLVIAGLMGKFDGKDSKAKPEVPTV